MLKKVIKELGGTLVFDIKAMHKSVPRLEWQSVFRCSFEIIRNVRIKSKLGTFVMAETNSIMANLGIVLCSILVLGS